MSYIIDMSRGYFIAFEGLDGSGTSSNAEAISDWLEENGQNVLKTSEPTDDPIGQILRDSLKGEKDIPLEAEALLFAGDRAIHVEKEIRPTLASGGIVVTDRYLYSSLAYQSARGLPEDWIKNVNVSAMRVKPDVVFLIDTPPEECIDRIKDRELDSFERNMDLQRKVRKRYKFMADKYDEIVVIDGAQSIEEIQKEIKNYLKEELPHIE